MGGTGGLILAFVLSLSLYEDAQIWAICLHPGRNSIAYGLSAWPGQPHSRAAAARCQPKPADEGGCALVKGSRVPGWLHGQCLSADATAYGNCL